MIIPTLLMAALLGANQVAPEGAGPGMGAEGPSEAEALVQRIKETLGRIDESLYEVPYADDVAGALEDVRQSHLEAIRDIEELIKQAQYSKGSQSSGGGGGGGGGSSQQQQQQQQSPRESDGSNAPDPSEQQGGNDPQQQQGEQDGQSEQEQQQPQGGEKPEGGMASGESPENQSGQQPPRDPLGDPTRDTTDGRWGLLPPKVQEQLMNLHVDDVPARYRSWLEAYVKALNAAEQEDGGR